MRGVSLPSYWEGGVRFSPSFLRCGVCSLPLLTCVLSVPDHPRCVCTLLHRLRALNDVCDPQPFHGS